MKSIVELYFGEPGPSGNEGTWFTESYSICHEKDAFEEEIVKKATTKALKKYEKQGKELTFIGVFQLRYGEED